MALLDFYGFWIVGFVCSGCALINVQPDEHQQWPQVDPSFKGKLPIEWVHVPKAGQSFINTLIHIPGVCPGLPKDLILSVENTGGYPSEGALPRLMKRFRATYAPELNCNTSTLDVELGRLEHSGLSDLSFEAGKGHFMGFFREPQQRILSNFYYGQNFFDKLPMLEIYVQRNAGVQTKILTRDKTFSNEPPTRSEVEKAKRRLQEGFSFIGITDQWDLSICLFNTMFNQACSSFQFLNVHPTPKTPSIYDYDPAQLNGWRDPYDNEIYDIAVKMFEANLKKYNVSKSFCETACWHQAGLISA